MLAMYQGTEGLDEALGYLSEARRQVSSPGAQAYLLGALVLVLDRQGRTQEARGVATEAGSPAVLTRQVPLPDAHEAPGLPSEFFPLLPPTEAYALTAVLAEGEYPDLARDYWQASLQGMKPEASWRRHAERKLAALSGR